jgi:FAD/FMN-containing dehydrogenase
MSELMYSRPGTAGYRDATTPRNSSASQHPALVASPRSAAELAAAVGYAAQHGLTAVPQATGHGASGELGDGVLLIDTARLDTVHIDAGRRRAVVGAGCQWGAINAAAERHGLLGRSGSAPDVSVCGFTFGGGAGWLTRPHGLASGALAAVDFVDGTGRIRRASDDAPDEGDREAIYAFRGGGGVGVAAALEFDLAAVTDLWAGYLLWPFEHLDSVAGAWADALARIGQALSTSISVLSAPPGPPFPPGLQGTRVVHLAVACSTGEADAAPLLDALSAVATPTVNTWGRADAARLGGIHLDPPAAGPALGIAHWLDAAAPSVAPAVLRAAADSPIEMIEIRNVGNDAPVLDGAMTRPIGDFILHAVGDQSDPQGREAAFARVLAAAAPADTKLSLGSWADGRASVPDALAPKARSRVAAARAAVDPEGTIAPSRFLA